MSPDPLDLIWRSADVGSPLFAADEMSIWRPGVAQSLIELGLLHSAKTASHVTCDACGENHRVGSITYPDGQTRFFTRCPENGRLEVDREHLLQWHVDFAPIFKALANGYGIKAESEEVVPNRVWKIGRAAIGGRSRVAWVARGLSWPDARKVAELLPKGKSPVLFLLGLRPENGLIDLRPDSIIELRDVMSLCNGKLVFDREGADDQLSAVPEPAKKTPKKRATRAATIDALQRELTAHLIAARDHAHAGTQRGDPPELLPRPMQKDLADRLGVPESAVSRALHDPAAHLVRVLWDTANNLDQVLKFRPPRRS